MQFQFMKPNFEPLPDTKPMFFSVTGSPVPYFKSRHTNRKMWDDIQSSIVAYKNNIYIQSPDIPPLTGPLFLNVEFYFPYRYKNDTYLKDRPHYILPQQSRLLQFVEESLQELEIITECGQIASSFIKKLYSDIPRTEFSLYEIVA